MTKKAVAMKQALTHFRRVGGQYKRRYGVDPTAYLAQETKTVKGVERALEAMRFDVEQEQITRRIEERERREREKTQEEETLAQMEIDNIKYELNSLVTYTQNNFAKDDVRYSVHVLNEIIDDSVNTYGPIEALEKLRPWAYGAASKLEHLGWAIYDKEYNTNSLYYRVDGAGDLGRQRYEADMRAFAMQMGVSCPPLFFLA